MNLRIQRAARAAAVLVCVALPACQQHPHASDTHPVPVKVRTVEKTGAGLARYSGTLDAAVRVDMAFRVGGYVEALGEVGEGSARRPIDKGDFVKKGTMLARLRPSEYAQKVATASAAASQARAQAKLADAELERSKKLFDTKAITKSELDARVAQADATKASVEGALAQAGEASVALQDTVLRAPMDGVVLARPVEIGALVAPGQHAVSIADVRTVKATFGAPQSLVEKLSIGTPLEVYVGADNAAKATDSKLDAKVTRIAPAADAQGRVFSVEAELPNDDGRLRPGSVVSIQIPDATLAAPSIAVPLSAVVRSPTNARGFAVFVLDGTDSRGQARLQDVELGTVLGNSVSVTSGLALGQRVVTVGGTLLRDGRQAVVIP